MNWKDIGDLVKPLAPVLGTILGGPLGGAAGSILASQLGTDATPSAVSEAIATGGEAITEGVKQAELTAAAKWSALAEMSKADATQATAINETMRAEVAAGRSWYAWRNLWGYSVTLECFLVSMEILYELFSGDFKAINAFTGLSGFFMSWYGMRIGVLGYVVSAGTRERVAAVTGESPSILGNLVKVVTGKK